MCVTKPVYIEEKKKQPKNLVWHLGCVIHRRESLTQETHGFVFLHRPKKTKKRTKKPKRFTLANDLQRWNQFSVSGWSGVNVRTLGAGKVLCG